MNVEEYWTMDNSSLIFPKLISAEDYATVNSTGNSFIDFCSSKLLRVKIIASIIFAVSIFGLLGNGTVIWLLGFCMKGTPFTTFILNLAVADFGVLMLSLILAIADIVEMRYHRENFEYYLRAYHLYFVSNTSQFLLTTIIIDRCVSVLFPIWYRCRRPKMLSAIVCAVIWSLSFLVRRISLAIEQTYERTDFLPRFIVILVNSVVCLTSITVATLILFVKFCFKSQQRKRGRLLMAIFLTLFFFLIFAFPINVISLIIFNPMHSDKDRTNVYCYDALEYNILCASLNSFVNPLLYFLVGRKKEGSLWGNPEAHPQESFHRGGRRTR